MIIDQTYSLAIKNSPLCYSYFPIWKRRIQTGSHQPDHLKQGSFDKELDMNKAYRGKQVQPKLRHEHRLDYNLTSTLEILNTQKLDGQITNQTPQKLYIQQPKSISNPC